MTSRRRSAPAPAVLAVLAGVVLAWPVPRARGADLTALPPAQAPRPSDQAADSLFSALRLRDYAGATALFDARMKSELAQEKLQRFVSIPGLNHLFIEGTGKPGPAEYDMPGQVDVRVIEALERFVKARRS